MCDADSDSNTWAAKSSSSIVSSARLMLKVGICQSIFDFLFSAAQCRTLPTSQRSS